MILIVNLIKLDNRDLHCNFHVTTGYESNSRQCRHTSPYHLSFCSTHAYRQALLFSARIICAVVVSSVWCHRTHLFAVNFQPFVNVSHICLYTYPIRCRKTDVSEVYNAYSERSGLAASFMHPFGVIGAYIEGNSERNALPRKNQFHLIYSCPNF